MGNIKYQLRKAPNKRKKDSKTKTSLVNLSYIYLIYWYNGIRFTYYTGQKINPDFWNEKEQRAVKRKGRHDLSSINSILDKFEQWLRSTEIDLILEEEEVTNEKLKQGIDKKRGKSKGKKKYKTFVEYGDHIVQSYKDMGKYPSALSSTVLMVRSFKPGVTFDNIDLTFHNELIAYMKRKDYSKNYIAKIIATVKLIMNIAVSEGQTKSIKYKVKQFNASRETVYNIYLSIEELEILHNKDFSKLPHLDNACDLFLIGAFTGLRFSDYAKMKGVNFEGGDFVVQDTMKVDSRLVIPQHRIVKEILAKRNGELPHSISNVKLNEYIKTVGEEAEIDQEVIKTRTKGKEKTRTTYKKYELITTHTARRSLATNMYLAGIPIKTIMTITGHSSVAQLMQYIKITEIEVAESLKDHSFFK